MAVKEHFFALVDTYERQIHSSTFTKSDAKYHITKQSLHNIWAKVYGLGVSNETKVLTEKIKQCLVHLDRATEQNEKRKYQNYYPLAKACRQIDGN